MQQYDYQLNNVFIIYMRFDTIIALICVISSLQSTNNKIHDCDIYRHKKYYHV